MSKISLLDRFSWQGSNRVYSVPWLRNRIEFSSDPGRIREFVEAHAYTRSQLTIDMLVRFHLSNHSIVVSGDSHSAALRARFLQCLPKRESYPDIAGSLVANLFNGTVAPGSEIQVDLAPRALKAVYLNLLQHLLGADVPEHFLSESQRFDIKPGKRPVHLEGLMFAFGLQFPGLTFMRDVIDFIYFRRDHYTRRIAGELVLLVDRHCRPKNDSWYAVLRQLRREEKLSGEQYAGELTSILVSAFSLSSALCSLLICLAARPGYRLKVRDDRRLARCFVSEVLRLYPPFRRYGYEKTGIWQQRYRPRRDPTDFMISVADLHVNPSIWEDPESFLPERFLTPGTAGGYRYLPFGTGTRSCIGRSFSLQLMISVLAKLCAEEFSWQLDLPQDYRGNADGMPVPVSGRLVSFPEDDRLVIRRLW